MRPERDFTVKEISRFVLSTGIRSRPITGFLNTEIDLDLIAYSIVMLNLFAS
jgi:hypothetical protein